MTIPTLRRNWPLMVWVTFIVVAALIVHLVCE